MDTYEELLSEDEFFEKVMDEFVSEEIEVDELRLETAIRCVPNFEDRRLIDVYIRYLERLTNY